LLRIFPISGTERFNILIFQLHCFQSNIDWWDLVLDKKEIIKKYFKQRQKTLSTVII
jgi:hypothetical protein